MKIFIWVNETKYLMDWINMRWDRGHQNHQGAAGEHFTFDCSGAKITDRSTIDIGIDVVKKISEAYPPPYNLMVSGGVDSQAMLYIWRMARVPFNAVSFKYNRTYNHHDLITLSAFANELKLKIDYRDFNVFSFLSTKLPEYAEKYQCTSPQICTYMAMGEEIQNGTLIYGGNFLFPKACSLSYTMLGLWRYAQQTKRNIIPFFFQHDAELSVSLIPIWKKLCSEKTNINANSSYLADVISYEDKIKLYHLAEIPVIPQLKKYSGFELIKDYYDARPNTITGVERAKYSTKPSKRDFDIMFRYRLAETIRYQDKLNYITCINSI